MANEKKLMDEIKKFIPKFKQHGQYQMSLSSLIKALQRERVGLLVKITDKHYPGRSHSYFGYHTDLAFEPVEEPITVAEFLKECEDSVGKSFITADHFGEFYKDYVMQINAPVWISTLGQASQKGIVDVVPTDGYIKLVTENIEVEEEEDGSK
jgi:peroxiredoxin family protein